jgi:hypothetical protein
VSYEGRVWTAMRLARDIGACEQLLRGEAVDKSRLDPDGLTWALQMRFARLDVAAVDEFYDQLHETEMAA